MLKLGFKDFCLAARLRPDTSMYYASYVSLCSGENKAVLVLTAGLNGVADAILALFFIYTTTHNRNSFNDIAATHLLIATFSFPAVLLLFRHVRPSQALLSFKMEWEWN